MENNDKNINKVESYVYEGKEVFLTGRTAVKEVNSRHGVKEKTLHEIKPIKYLDSKSKVYVPTQWVEIKDLFLVEGTEFNYIEEEPPSEENDA